MYAASAPGHRILSFHHRGLLLLAAAVAVMLFFSTAAWQGRRTAPGGGWCSSLSHRFQVVVRLRFFRSKFLWYNVRGDMKNKPAPLLNPGTLKPMTARELGGVFCDELDDTTA